MRTVQSALQTHLDGSGTTTCRLVKIKLKNGVVYGITTLDTDVPYDDGTEDGEIAYVASNGFDPSVIAADTGYSVDNSEGYALISDDVPGVTLEMVEAGDLDDAEWTCYLVNYRDTSMGHVVLDAGHLGQVRTRFGMVWIPEFLSYMMTLRQPIGSVWSTTCRAIFGSSADSQTGCGVNVTSLWVSGEALSIGAESNRVFEADAVLDSSSSAVLPVPGRLQWLTGDNAGREYAIESIDSSLMVTLAETTPYPISVGDTYRIRPDCRKRYAQDCIGIWNNGPNFKGEPLIPVGDASAGQFPGGQLPGGGGWTGGNIVSGGD